jgi:hypothetical protein
LRPGEEQQAGEGRQPEETREALRKASPDEQQAPGCDGHDHRLREVMARIRSSDSSHGRPPVGGEVWPYGEVLFPSRAGSGELLQPGTARVANPPQRQSLQKVRK